jgi:hypothetical protein
VEAATYLTVAAALVVAGVLLRTVVLNWLVGPAAVVIGVMALSAAVERRRSG